MGPRRLQHVVGHPEVDRLLCYHQRAISSMKVIHVLDLGKSANSLGLKSCVSDCLRPLGADSQPWLVMRVVVCDAYLAIS